MNLHKREQEIVAGALYDFCGFITTSQEPFEVGSSCVVYPVMEHLKEWAYKRGLSLEEADVMNWSD